MVIFSEGSTHNNRYLNAFKRGAFEALRSVMPLVIHYDVSNCDIHPFGDVCTDAQIFVMFCSCFQMCTVTVTLFPPFQPNEHLFKQHADKGEEKWEIFAWAIRKFMIDHSHLGDKTQQLRQKMPYWQFLFGDRDTYVDEKAE